MEVVTEMTIGAEMATQHPLSTEEIATRTANCYECLMGLKRSETHVRKQLLYLRVHGQANLQKDGRRNGGRRHKSQKSSESSDQLPGVNV